MNRYVFIGENDIIIWVNYDKNIVGFKQGKSRVGIESMGGDMSKLWIRFRVCGEKPYNRDFFY